MKQPPTTTLRGEDKKAFNVYKTEILAELERPANQTQPQEEKETDKMLELMLKEQPAH